MSTLPRATLPDRDLTYADLDGLVSAYYQVFALWPRQIDLPRRNYVHLWRVTLSNMREPKPLDENGQLWFADILLRPTLGTRPVLRLERTVK